MVQILNTCTYRFRHQQRNMSAATPLELRLSKVVDEGAIFSIFSIVSAIEDFAIVAANYRYHEAVAAMGLIRAYPREWKGEAVSLLIF